MQRPRAKGGTGLGLSICSKQVAVLGGCIGALSKMGAGSVFWFAVPLELPRASSSSDGQGAEEEREAAMAAGAQGSEHRSLTPSAFAAR